MKRPLIGFTLDYEEGGGYSALPWYAIRENYCTSVSRCGGVPLALPHEVALVSHYLDVIDGLIVTGGNFDVPPEMYGQQTTSDKVTLKQRRTQFEWAMCEGALKRKMPILGICGGQQLLNVVLGGTLIQHIPDTVANCLAHEQPNPRTEPGHKVTAEEGTLLRDIVGVADFEVNSAHHQAVDRVADGVIINSIAPDGVIEGIELPVARHPFCLGVQWHPEYHISGADEKIFAAFVESAAEYGDDR